MKLVIGNRTYSSWSLRAWLAARASGADFEDMLLPLDTPEFYSRIKEISRAARVPVLIDGETHIWDSLAIIEYLAETFPAAGLWPRDKAARAQARSVVAEFHSGFFDLRGNYPMNLRRAPAVHPGAPDAARDIARVCEIWRDCRARFGGGGDFLFGAFSAADCFYAPVVSRFLTYRLPLGEVEAAYAHAVMEHPFMREWREAAAAETLVVAADEVD
ncbi:glutathione S-transferase family protein [Stappia sp. ICDLI1TA098]|jgi:glutathione S-transferase